MNDLRLQQRISAFWFIILIGLLFHIMFHLVPVFYGINIVKTGAKGVIPVYMIFTLGLSFCIPVFAVIHIYILKGNTGKLINLVLSIIALVVNTGHLYEIVFRTAQNPLQLFVLIPLFITSVILVTGSFKWFKLKL